jgi:dTDP-4-dehydrorhamnose reductase
MRVLITGAGGQVGRELVRAAPPQAEVRALDRNDLDIGDAVAVRAAVADFAPTVIINAAGYTAVDKAEQEHDLALRVNAEGPRLLAQAARGLHGCRLVHISTDYVFDGTSAHPYRPGDAPHPLGVYGRTKLEGEDAVLGALGPRAVVLRTSWVYGAHGRNFLHTMLRLMRERGAVRVVADQIGTPTSTPALAEALWQFAKRPGLAGVYHWTDAGVASWYDFAVAIAEEAAAIGLLPPGIEVTPIATEDYPTPARRPACSVLDTRATVTALALEPRHWRQRLREELSRLRAAH